MYPKLPFLLFFFILGISVGSFLNVLIDRLPNNESIRGRSLCDHCKTTLKASDLVPLLSFILLRGRCRYCHKKIAWQYPIVEISTATLFAISYLYFDQIYLIFYLPMIAGLIAVFFTDLKYQIIPNKIIYPLIFLALLSRLIKPGFIMALVAGLVACLFFLLLVLVTKGRGMGGGDVKLGFLLGLLLGWPKVLVGLYIAFVLGGLVAAILLLMKKKRFGQTVPFGPFLVIGTLLGIFYGDKILGWYLERFIM